MEYEFDENGVVIAVNSKKDDQDEQGELVGQIDMSNTVATNIHVEQPVIDNDEGPEYKFDENGMIIGIIEK